MRGWWSNNFTGTHAQVSLQGAAMAGSSRFRRAKGSVATQQQRATPEDAVPLRVYHLAVCVGPPPGRIITHTTGDPPPPLRTEQRASHIFFFLPRLPSGVCPLLHTYCLVSPPPASRLLADARGRATKKKTPKRFPLAPVRDPLSCLRQWRQTRATKQRRGPWRRGPRQRRGALGA